MDCNCSEGQTKRTIGQNQKGQRIFDTLSMPTDLHVHNCNYIARRDRVLDRAERIADEISGGRWKEGWHKTFFAAVNELSKPLTPDT